jgi:hypothetical protein
LEPKPTLVGACAEEMQHPFHLKTSVRFRLSQFIVYILQIKAMINEPTYIEFYALRTIGF